MEQPDKLVGDGMLQRVDVESLNNMIQQYEKILEENTTKKNQFQKFRDDYVALRTRLKTLPEKLEYEAMVPVCSKALCPGKIIHTNEILCLLGDNWFVECTAKKAAEIVSHRLKSIDDTLNRLDKERELYNSWKFEAERQMVESLGEGTIEIVEEYDEDREAEWRKKHRESVKRYYQQRAEERKKQSSPDSTKKLPEKTETELWTRLDALELEEEFMEAQAAYEDKLYNGKDTSVLNEPLKRRDKNRVSFDDFLESETANALDSSSLPNGNSGKKVTFNPENIIHNLGDLSLKDGKRKNKELDEVDKEEIELYKPSETSDNGLFEPIFIRFRHGSSLTQSDSTKEDENSVNNDEIDSNSDSDDTDSSEFDDYQVVVSPGDIYEYFGPPSLDAKPSVVPGANKTPLKSILKPRGSVAENGVSLSQDKFITAESNTKPKQKETIILPDVSERLPKKSVQVTSTSPAPAYNNHASVCSTKPVSLFKRMKQGGAANPPPKYQEG